MKKILFLCIAAIALTACDDDKDDRRDNDRDYVGTMTVVGLADPTETYEWSYQEFEVEYERDGSITLQLDDVRFVPQMPILDMDFPGIRYTETQGVATLQGDNIVPQIAGRPYQQYLVTDLSGTASERQLDVTFVCMNYRVTYTGTLKID
ncbi:MAG: calycin-like domain-containing protein [Alistipes sp.]|nr:calycin-like domain-containing protein [Alistipes senegalensis]MCM1250921.1 calycin-like domain-containing protein [Alistipes sp.]